ncbi:hypothetical protein DZK27_13865 [Rhodobacteraceae bacterium 63075]|nr:hypothetical protein DZK27_13865 [Rhodobacteraceae bacterium 63075]
MHLVEFALRDFINVESYAHKDTVVVIDDVAPGDIAWASRERETQAWTGDVYRLIPLLREYRPDLDIEVFDAEISGFDKGVAVISNLDTNSTMLSKQYDAISSELSKGAYLEKSSADIRERLNVRASSDLKSHIESLSRPSLQKAATVSVDPETTDYLDLLKKRLLTEPYRKDEFRLHYLRRCLNGEDSFDQATYIDITQRFPNEYTSFEEACTLSKPYKNNISNLAFTHTMMGKARLDNLHDCLDQVFSNGIPGDLMECGVWRGGAGIFMAGYARAHGQTARRILVADSFEGLPKPSHPQDSGLVLDKERYPELAISQETVADNFAAYDLLGENVVFLKGWFKDTLHEAPTDQIALLRLDGDLYESTMDALKALYDKVAEGGVVIIDDYGAIKACRQAVQDFFDQRGERQPDVIEIDWTGVYWIKQKAQ